MSKTPEQDRQPISRLEERDEPRRAYEPPRLGKRRSVHAAVLASNVVGPNQPPVDPGGND